VSDQHQEPYCGNCGHQLTGLVDSSKCPECGKPLVEVLSRGAGWGKRFRSKARLFGLPIVDYAYGPVPGEPPPHARGIIAVGDKATGVLALGGQARGLVAIGGVAMGGFTIGGVSLGLFSACGGVAIGLVAWGGVALGLLVSGGLAAGFFAAGGLSVGYYAMGGSPLGVFTLGPGSNDQEAVDLLRYLRWFFGPSQAGIMMIIQPLLATVGSTLGIAALIGIVAAWGHRRAERATEEAGLRDPG